MENVGNCESERTNRSIIIFSLEESLEITGDDQEIDFMAILDMMSSKNKTAEIENGQAFGDGLINFALKYAQNLVNISPSEGDSAKAGDGEGKADSSN